MRKGKTYPEYTVRNRLPDHVLAATMNRLVDQNHTIHSVLGPSSAGSYTVIAYKMKVKK